MKSSGMIVVLALVAVIVASTLAAENTRDLRVVHDRGWTPRSNDAAGKAVRDTVYIMGGPGLPNTGDFEAPGGGPAWNGFTHYDGTVPASNHWHVDTYHMENLHGNGAGNRGAWCGALIPP